LKKYKGNFFSCRTRAGWPDWSNFRLLNDGLLWDILPKIWEVVQILLWPLFLHSKRHIFILTKKNLAGPHFGQFLANSSGHTGHYIGT
jgi:hypothetical protein